jgi:hypothetical protein
MLALLSRREMRSTHSREVAKREDAEQTGLAASAIADDDEFPEPSPPMSAIQSSSGSPDRRSAAELPRRRGNARVPHGDYQGGVPADDICGIVCHGPGSSGSGFWVGQRAGWGRACGGSGDGLLSAPGTARKSPPLLVGRRSSLVVSRGFAVFGSFKWAWAVVIGCRGGGEEAMGEGRPG